MDRNSLFLFSIRESIQNIEEYEAVISFGGFSFKYLKNTPVCLSRDRERELLIYGYCVDVRDGTSDALSETILSKTGSLEDVIAYESHLGGKYILLYRDAAGAYAIPDATASIPFCYATGTYPLTCAADSEAVAQMLALQPDKTLLEIRKKSDISQAMPYDLTVYGAIKQLLPNHYFSFSEKKAIRFVNHEESRKPVTPVAAAVQTAPLIENLLRYYKQQYKLYCPITSGRDSRVVLSFMLSLDKDVETYTIKHDNFSDNEPDIVIPKQIARSVDVINRQICDIEPPEQVCQRLDKAMGATGYSKRTLMIANTIKNAYGDGAIVNGDIIGQVGKCSLHRDIPERLASARYFRCKLHNYSKASISYIKKWIAEIKDSGECVNLFDLFSVENRMGRWAAQSYLVYSMLGQPNLNIFNSRSIIYLWTLVPRKDRKLSEIHKAFIRLKYPVLLEVPFGEDRSLFKIAAKHNGFGYYLASFVKYYAEKIRFVFVHRR